MNILHIASNYPPDIGGPAASVPYLAEEQRRLGHNIFILTHGNPAHSNENNIEIYRCGKINGNNVNITTGLMKCIKMGLLGRKIVKKNKIDIIHSHDPNVSAITKILIDPSGKIPSVVKYSGDLAWETIGLKSKKYIESGDRFWTTTPCKIIHIIERLIFSRFNKIIAQNNYQKKILIKHLKSKEEKITLIPNGIKTYKYTKKDIEDGKKELPEGNKICTAARLVPWKGIGYVIKSIKKEDVKYIIFGDGPEKNYLKKLAKKEGVAEKVTFFGKVQHDKIQKYLRSCDMLIVPSIYEPFSIVTLEGFAAKIPVIGSNIGGLPQLIEKKCRFNIGTEDIKEKIEYALRNKKTIIKTQNKKLRKYSWNRIAKNTIKEYEELERHYKRSKTKT